MELFVLVLVLVLALIRRNYLGGNRFWAWSFFVLEFGFGVGVGFGFVIPRSRINAEAPIV